MKRRLIPALLVLAALAGCASPESRIHDNPGAYAALTPAQQALVKQGRIDLGMSQEGVRLALGNPNHVNERTDASGLEVVWHYTIEVSGYTTAFVDPWFYGPYWGPAPVIVEQQPQERDKTRVVFRGGKVVAIERET